MISTQRVSLADSPPSLPYWLHTPGESNDWRARSESQQPGELRVPIEGFLHLSESTFAQWRSERYILLVNFIFWSSFGFKTKVRGIPGWRSGLVPAFGPGRDPGDPGSNPTSGTRCMEPASPSACVSASLSHCVPIINK